MGGDLIMKSCTLYGNTAAGGTSNSVADGKGGAIYTRKSTAVVGSYFHSNSVSGLRTVSGGDVYIQSGNFSTSDCENGNGANGTLDTNSATAYFNYDCGGTLTPTSLPTVKPTTTSPLPSSVPTPAPSLLPTVVPLPTTVPSPVPTSVPITTAPTGRALLACHFCPLIYVPT